MIRKKDGLRRARVPGNAVNDENFLIAKIQDSESATALPTGRERLTRSLFAHDAHHLRIQESTAAQALSACLTIADVGRNGVFRIPISKARVVAAHRAAAAREFLRQHFLKRDAVFFDVLVYSE